MKKPVLPQVSCKYGAPMGRVECIPSGEVSCKVHLQKLVLSDGVYDSGGAYWGNVQGQSLYWAYSNRPQTPIDLFVRAATRESAKIQLKARFPQLSFYR